MAWIQERRWAGGAKVAYQVREKSLGSGKIVVIKTFKTEREARKFLQGGEATADNIVSFDVRRATFGEVAQRWLDARERGSDGDPAITRDTLDNYRSVVRCQVAPFIGGRIANDFLPSDARAYRGALLGRFSKQRAKWAVSMVRGMYAWFIAQHDLRRGNPFDHAGVRLGDGDKKERVVPTHAEVRALLMEAVALQRVSLAKSNWRKQWLRYAPMVWMLALVGSRQGEMRAACWTAIDLDGGLWRIEQAANRRGGIKQPKTASSRRAVRLPPVLVDMLREWRKHCPITPGHLVFPTRGARPILQSYIATKVWSPLMTACGFLNEAGKPRFTPHSLRHFKLSDDIMRGDDIKEVQARSGHARASTLLDIYAKPFQERAAREEGGKATRLSDALQLVRPS